MEDQEFVQALEDAVQDYMAVGEEAKGVELLTADMLPAEVKEAMGLHMFPEDIQNDILALSQKLVEYAQALAQPEEEAKGPFGGPPTRYAGASQQSFGRALINCWATVPSGQIMRDSLRAAGRVTSMNKGSPLAPYRTALGIGAVGAYSGAATAGWVAGCMQRTPHRPMFR